MNLKSRNNRAQPLTREKYFTLSVKLLVTGEIFKLKKIYNELKISQVKSQIEFAAGIPYHMQRLSYLDEGDLLDKTDVKGNDIVAGGTLQLRVWNQWSSLVEAAATNDIDWLMKLGVGKHHDYKTPISDYMTVRSKKEWLAERKFVALFIAAHRGHHKLCEKIIDSGVDIDGQTPLGRSALHVASANGHGTIIDFLLEKGADIDAVDKDGNTALAIATIYAHKDCERHLFLFRWQERAKNTKPNFDDLQRMAHQFFDSNFPVWLNGTQGQIYYTQIMPPGEFEGTAFHSPKRRHRPSSAPREREMTTPENEMPHMTHEDIQVALGRETYQHSLEFEVEANKHADYLKSLALKKPYSLKGDRMPAIEEQSDIGSKVTPGGNAISAQTRDALDNSGRPRSYGFSKIEKKATRKDKTKDYDSWLAEKKKKEQIKLDKKIAIEEEKKRRLEDKERESEIQQLGYDAWLEEKQKATSKDSKNASKKAAFQRQEAEKAKKKENIKTYDSWLFQKEMELLEKVKQGK